MMQSITFTGTPGVVIPAGTSVEVSSDVAHPDYGTSLQRIWTRRFITIKDAVVQADCTVTVDVVDSMPDEVRRILRTIIQAKIQ